MACSRIPKWSTRPCRSPVHSYVDHSGGTKERAPSMVVLLDSARSAEPPQSSGRAAANALMTLPDAARVDTSVSPENSGRTSASPSGKIPASRRSNSAFLSEFFAAQASKLDCHCARAAAPRVIASRVCAMMSASTSKNFSGSNLTAFLSPASSSAPSADP